MYLHIRFVPAIIKLLKLNYSVEFLYYKLKDVLLEERRLQQVTNKKNLFDLVIQSDDINDLLNGFKKASQVISQELKIPSNRLELLPMQMVILENPEVFEGVWRICPTGNVLIMLKEVVPNSKPWLYGSHLISLDPTQDLTKKVFPLRSLLIVGNYKTECFFCGSHFHESHQCPNKWLPQNILTAEYLSKNATKNWLEDIKTMFQAGDTYGNRLETLLADLRREFSWYFAYKIAKTKVNSFTELFESPTSNKDTPFDRIFEAMEKGDDELIKVALENAPEKSDASLYPILRGLFEVHQQKIDKALVSFITAENSNINPVYKTYAKLLRFRLYFVNGQYDECFNLLDHIDKDFVAPLEYSYQRALLSAVTHQPQALVNLIRKFTKNPRWFTACLCEPLFLIYENKVESLYSDTFNELIKKSSELYDFAHEYLKTLRELFGEEAFLDLSKELMEINTQIVKGSYSTIYNSYFDLIEFKKKLNRKRRDHTKLLIQKLNSSFQQIKNWLSSLPTNSRTKPFKDACALLMNETKEFVDFLVKTYNNEDSEVHFESYIHKAKKITSEFNSLKEQYPNLVKQEKEMMFYREITVNISVFVILFITTIFLVILLTHLF